MFYTLSAREKIIFTTFSLWSANALKLVKAKILLFGKELKEFADDRLDIANRMVFVCGGNTNFGLFQSEMVCRRQFQI